MIGFSYLFVSCFVSVDVMQLEEEES